MELIALEIHGYYGNLDCLKAGYIHFRTPYLAKGDELQIMKEFGAYMLDSGLVEDVGSGWAADLRAAADDEGGDDA